MVRGKAKGGDWENFLSSFFQRAVAETWAKKTLEEMNEAEGNEGGFAPKGDKSGKWGHTLVMKKRSTPDSRA